MRLGWSQSTTEHSHSHSYSKDMMRYRSTVGLLLLALVISSALKPPVKKGGLKKGGEESAKGHWGDGTWSNLTLGGPSNSQQPRAGHRPQRPGDDATDQRRERETHGLGKICLAITVDVDWGSRRALNFSSDPVPDKDDA